MDIRKFGFRISNPPAKRTLLLVPLLAIFGPAAFAQSDPWTTTASALQTTFQGPLATSLITVAIVIGGLMLAHGETHGKKIMGGIAAGGGLTLLAPRVINWLFS
jgi:type IV secretory pathway VirB2 component (pilin)